ncbi:MAG: hypothetical protein ABSB97_04850 [Thermoplasmata archaeon]
MGIRAHRGRKVGLLRSRGSTGPTGGIPAPSFFHAYDVRGRYPVDIDAAAATQLGRAVARVFPGPILVGRDTRAESVPFCRHVLEGLASEGSPTGRMGVVPTPLVAFAAARWKLTALSATASHNPLGYVGLKGFDLHGRIIGREWSRIRAKFTAAMTPRTHSAVREAGFGSIPSPAQVQHEYLRWVGEGARIHGTVVLDPRGGATARLAVRTFLGVGARVVPIDATFSADFFGRSPEPKAGNLATLGRTVRRHHALLGATFDGDGDRVLFVDGAGKYVEPELVALLLYRRRLSSDGVLVASVDASRRLDQFARVRRSRVGTRFVIEAMRREKAEVGVEASSHIYLGREYESSDGIRVAVELARMLDADSGAVERLRSEVGPIVRATGALTFADFKGAGRAYDLLRQTVSQSGTRSIDGFLVLGDLGDCLIRKSNTQPSVRFALEAESEADLHRLARATAEWAGKVARTLKPSAPLRFE